MDASESGTQQFTAYWIDDEGNLVNAQKTAYVRTEGQAIQGQIDGLAEVAELACKQIDREAHMSLTVLEKLAFDLEHGPLTATREAPAEHENPLVTAILKEVSQ